jgi:hypothetical protein
MSELFNEKRQCPFCGKKDLKKPYWRHVQTEHPSEFSSSIQIWKQLYLDYRTAGMTQEISILAICELFNKPEEVVREFLEKEHVL